MHIWRAQRLIQKYKQILFAKLILTNFVMQMYSCKIPSYKRHREMNLKSKLFAAFVFIFTIWSHQINEREKKKICKRKKTIYNWIKLFPRRMRKTKRKTKWHENEINTFDFNGSIWHFRAAFPIFSFSIIFWFIMFPATNGCHYSDDDMRSRRANYFVHWLWILERDRYVYSLVDKMMLPFKLNHNKVENCDSRDRR